MALRICKWKTRRSNININVTLQLQSHRMSFSHSIPVIRDDENKANEKVKVMDKSNKHGSLGHMESRESIWKSVFATPYKWYDYRMIKKNQKAPDFKHIETGEVLWIGSRKTPNWVESKVRSIGREAFASSQSLEQMWISFFIDPSKWLDCRKNKKSGEHPDFLHKYTREALWLKGKQVPIWVVPMLESLSDESFEPSLTGENLWKSLFAEPSKWFDHRKTKKTNTYPDFVHRVTHDALWIKGNRNPKWVKSAINNIRDEAFAPFPSSENLWKSFFANPSKWLDYRKIKKNKSLPDFKHKENGSSLWTDSRGTPSWVLPMLKGLPVDAFASSSSLEDLWISFFSDQSNWIDYREIKNNNDLPDFVHKDTAEALWTEAIVTPSWVTPMLDNLQSKEFAPFPTKENAWITLLANPSKWLDYRKNKKNNNFPDFKHKENREALWIDNQNTPDWVIPKLNDLRDEAFASSLSVEDLWISFFFDRLKWLDYRTIKKSDKHPDFVHKVTAEALWIEDAETPGWATHMLTDLQTEAFAPSTSKEILWKALFADPSKWFDNRRTKIGIKYPDFKHKNTGEGLWLDDRRIPSWVVPKLEELRYEVFAGPDEIFASHDLKWKAFFACPSNWFDNRTTKIAQINPDFKHKETKEGLWIASSLTPDWVAPSLKKLENEAFASSKRRISKELDNMTQ